MDEWGNVKLEYFEKNKLIYSVPNVTAQHDKKISVNNGIDFNNNKLRNS